MSRQIKILFVCTGNICRSPMAEAMFNHKVESLGLDTYFRADSAGTHGFHQGAEADPRTIAKLQEKSVPAGGLVSRRLVGDDYTDFDYLVAMDRGHQEVMSAQMPLGLEKPTPLMMDYAQEQGWPSDVPDPYYGEGDGFEHVYQMLEDAIQGMLASLTQQYDINTGEG